MWVKFKHVHRVKARNGKLYYYHRPSGTRLPDDPDSAEFAARLDELNAKGPPARSRACEGTTADLIERYKASDKFKKKAARTRADYMKRMDFLVTKFGDVPAKGWTTEEVLELQDALSDAPRQADYMVQVLSILFNFARRYPSRFGLLHNPASPVERIYEPDGYKPWPDNLIAAFRKKAEPELRWIMEGALYTGQRQGDLIRMAWSAFDGQFIDVVQGKTGERLAIPCPAPLLRVLDRIPKRATVIFTNKRKRMWGLDHLRHQITRTVRASGFEGYSLHGLRKNAARNLADAGCSNDEIMAITGHKTDRMVRLYTRSADQKRRAMGAIAKLESGTKLEKTADQTVKTQGATNEDGS